MGRVGVTKKWEKVPVDLEYQDGSGYSFILEYGDGSGYGCGTGLGQPGGYGRGIGTGSGSGVPCQDGYKKIDGSGHVPEAGYGFEYGNGAGSGVSEGQPLTYPISRPILCWHYVRTKDQKLVLRDGRTVEPKQVLHEPEILICEKGLHASMSQKDAKHYAPSGRVVPTRVAVWGDVVFEGDKLVGQYRQIIEVHEGET